MTINPLKKGLIKMNRALRDILLEASEDELRDAFADTGEDLDALANKAAAQRPLRDTRCRQGRRPAPRPGVLLQMLRRRERLSIDELAQNARVYASELRRIELDPVFDPNPRTIFQLAQYFKLPRGALSFSRVPCESTTTFREEAVRFAASSDHISGLTREQRKHLNQFVKFLRELTD